LPDLMFVGESSIPGFVTVGEQMQVNATVKNAGVSNTTAFQIGFYINDNLIDFVPVEGMQAGEEKQINFSLEDTASFLGLNMAKILIDSTNSIPELDEANNVIEKGVGIGFNSFNVILNYNNTELLGDAREYRVIKREGGKPEPNVLTVITFPDGRKQELSTNESGINNFQLTQSGLYLLFASKDKFDAFEGSFVIPKITLLNLAQSYNVGDTVLFIVQTEEGKKIKDAIVQIKDSANRITELRTDLDGKVEFRPIVGGPHGLTISRNGVPIMVTGFLSIGAIESVFGGGGIEQILFGSTIKNPPQFIFLLLLTFGAAFIAFSRSKLLFKAGPKSTREEQLENVARLLIAVAFFLVPFQAANFLGYNVGIAIVIIEALAAFMYENYRKGKKKRPPIKV
ncbi:MAG: hypothetical protein HYW50_01885, partial [Candidatus Diapherotrites archaeon]|nr:hypothetical protein [Candidatus Diapherotrites archaeon]